MIKSEAIKFRLQLEALQTELLGLEDTLKESGAPVVLDQTRVGRLTRMDAMQSQQIALEVGRRRQQQLLLIEAALQRLDAGEYGDCLVCAEAIDPRRLKIDPAQTLCIACADK